MTVQLQLADSGSQVVVDLGESVEVRLAEIGGTGYLWQIVNDIGNELGVSARTEHQHGSTPVDDPTASPVVDDTGPAPGAAAQRVFEFVASAPTDTVVALKRFPPWLDEGHADAAFEVRITVRPPSR